MAIKKLRSQGLPDTVSQTYLLVLGSIGLYLVGAYLPLSIDLIALLMVPAIIASFIFVIMVSVTEQPIYLFAMAFSLGIIHTPVFLVADLIDPTIITEALVATFMVFVGLTYLAFNTSEYDTFALYGFLYSALSTMIWLGLFNIFVQNDIVEILVTYFSILMFSGFIIVDTHEMLKDKTRSPVRHATQLFLDFINMFINLLDLLADLKKKKKK